MLKLKGLLVWGFLIAVLAPLPGFCNYRTKILNIIQNPALRNTRIGVEVEVLGSGKELFGYNSRIPLIPASNLKILSSGCSLLNLGPDFRFTTAVLGGPMADGVMSGNLVLRGGGDPTWSTDFYPSAITPLLHLAQKLKDAGVKTIEGDLVVDDSIFSREYVGKGWKKRYQWEDYAAEIGALSINKNEVQILVAPAAYGEPPKVIFYPPNHVIKATNLAVTTHGVTGLSFSRNRLKNHITIRGKISRYHPGAVILFNVHDPPLFTGSVFAEVLKKSGIKLLGKVRLITAAEIGQNSHLFTLATVQSPPLLTIVHRMNKESDNFLAEHLFRMLGAARFGKGSIANGGKAISYCLEDAGVQEAYLTLADGSGLSARDRVSPRTFVDFLRKIAARPVGAAFISTLPRGCASDGTLEDRLCGISVSAKTGAIRHVNTLSGFLTTENGEKLVFSIMLNHHPGSSEYARYIIDSIVKALADSPGV